MKKKIVKMLFCVVFLLIFLDYGEVRAEDVDLSDIEKTLEDIMPEEDLSFEELYAEVIAGKLELGEEFLERAGEIVFSEFSAHRHNIMVVLLLMVLSAVFSNFTSVFKDSQVAELGFYSMYLLMIMVLMKDFLMISESVGESIGNLSEFVRAMIPAYCIAAAATGSVNSATAFYQLILVLACVIQYLLSAFLLPLANTYVVLTMVNYLAKEDFLTKMADLIKKVIEWSLKAMIAVVAGFNVIQGLVAPAVDSVKTAVLNKTMSAVPGVGNAAGAVTEMVIGSASLIKNGIGAAGLIVIAFICLSPVIKVLVFAFAYRLAGACMQPVSDKRLLGGVGGIADGSILLFRIVFTAALTLMFSIAVLAASTGG